MLTSPEEFIGDPLAVLRDLTLQLEDVSQALRLIESPQRRIDLLRKFRYLLNETDRLIAGEFLAEQGPRRRAVR
jgi:hypothetical protein